MRYVTASVVIHTHTHIHTHENETVTLAAHALRVNKLSQYYACAVTTLYRIPPNTNMPRPEPNMPFILPIILFCNS